MDEQYSRPLSVEARARLIDFVEAYSRSMMRERADELDELAKRMAIAALQTDIDILAFSTTVSVLCSPSGVEMMQKTVWTATGFKQVSTMLVDMVESARARDRAYRRTLPRT